LETAAMPLFERPDADDGSAGDLPEDDFRDDDSGPGAVAHPAILEVDPRQTVKRLFLFSIAAFLFGLWCFWPIFENEHRRMDPWKSVLVWVGDVTGLIWFTVYFTRHHVLGQPFREGGITAGWWLALLSLAGAIGFDLAVTISLRSDELAGFARAVVAQGVMIDIKKKSASEYHQYHVRCRFPDGQGNWHDARFQIGEQRKTGRFPAGLPAEVGQTLRNGQVPSPLPVVYDPERPARNWVAGIDPEEGQRFHWWLVLIMLFQVVAIGNFVVFVRQKVRTRGRLPWWYDLHMVLPFLVQAACLGFLGGLMRGVGFLVELAFN
jgi:hypothetical protein